jgi:hypothetical protein
MENSYLPFPDRRIVIGRRLETIRRRDSPSDESVDAIEEDQKIVVMMPKTVLVLELEARE